jgi:hypothetical protein
MAQPDPRTVELVHETVVRQIQTQASTWDSLDAKALGLLAIGGAFITLGSLAPGTVPVALVVAAVAFLCVAGLSLATVWPQDFYGPASTQELVEQHLHRDRDALLVAIVRTAALESARHNAAVMSAKAQLIAAGLVALGVEAACVAAWVVSGVVL